MNFIFNNIDEKYIKSRPEYMGDIQPKFWFSNKTDMILVKRQHSQKVSGQPQKSKMFNHYGEYFGYLLAQKSEINSCPVDLISVHDTKNKYSHTKHLYTACGSKKLLTPSQNMMLGELVIGAFEATQQEKFKEILSKKSDIPYIKNRMTIDPYDNIDIVLESIVAQTIRFEIKACKHSSEQVKADIQENVKSAIDMMIYDCMFGNNDRHSQNWAMCTDTETGRATFYPLYDNERVLGLSIPEADVKRAVANGDLDNKTEQSEFSRMGISPVHTGVSYKAVLEHLVNNYPEYAIPTIKRITDKVNVQDIEKLYDSCKGITQRSEFSDELTPEDELPEEYKTYGVALYTQRREFARDLLEKYKNERATTARKEDDEEVMTI